MKWPSHNVNTIRSKKSHPGKKLAPVWVFWCKHPLTSSLSGFQAPLWLDGNLGWKWNYLRLGPQSPRSARRDWGRKGQVSTALWGPQCYQTCSNCWRRANSFCSYSRWKGLCCLSRIFCPKYLYFFIYISSQTTFRTFYGAPKSVAS